MKEIMKSFQIPCQFTDFIMVPTSKLYSFLSLFLKIVDPGYEFQTKDEILSMEKIMCRGSFLYILRTCHSDAHIKC